jgi:hypothetical protein
LLLLPNACLSLLLLLLSAQQWHALPLLLLSAQHWRVLPLLLCR